MNNKTDKNPLPFTGQGESAVHPSAPIGEKIKLPFYISANLCFFIIPSRVQVPAMQVLPVMQKRSSPRAQGWLTENGKIS